MTVANAMATVACSQTICDRVEEAAYKLQVKAQNCHLPDGGPIIRVQPQAKLDCEAELPNCTQEDFDTIQRELDCYAGLPTCEPGGDDAWTGQFVACTEGPGGCR